MGSGKGTQSNTSSQSSSSPPPQVMAEYQALVNRATNAANQPYQQYPGELVAPLSGQTASGLGQTSAASGTAQPFMNAAAGATMAAATPVQPTAFSPGQVGQYMNPYTQAVIDATQAQFNNQDKQSAQFLNSQNISSGAFGGDRSGISQAILANQQQTAQAPVIAGLYNQNYNQALSEFNTQQGVGLQAQAFNNQQLGQMGRQLGDIGTADQSAALQGAMANVQAGLIPQQEQQQIDTALYNQYLQQQSYPFQTTGWLGNIVEGTGSLSGGTSQGTSQTTSQQGSPISAGLGSALSGLGMLGSFLPAARGGRISDTENHEPIGRTFDGHTIYRFNYKGDPRTQIGTRDPPQRGHFAFGGAPQQNLDTLPPVGQQAIVMGALGDQGAKSGMGNIGLMASSPTTALAAARPGFQGGGETPDAFGDLNSFDPTTGLLNPQAGIANDLYDSITQGSKSPQFGIDTGVAQAVGQGPPNLATPFIQIPGGPQNYPALDWQQPGNDFQTAGAEASLQGLEARPGVETSPSESNPAASSLTSAVGKGGPGGGAGNLPPGLASNLGAWASGNPAAFGSDATAQPGTMPGVSVGQRMAPITAALGAPGPAIGGGGGGGGNGIMGASPPRAAMTQPAPAAAAPPPQQMPQGHFETVGGGQWGGGATSTNAHVEGGQIMPTEQVWIPGPWTGGRWTGGRIGRAAGGMLGQSGMAAALQQPPQQAMVTGQNPANQPGFNNLFGGSGGMRPTFAGGGGADNPAIGVDPFGQVVSWVPTVANTVMGHGPPQPSTSPGGGGGGGKPSGDGSGGMPDLSKSIPGLKKLWNDVTGQGAPATPAPPAALPVTPVPSGQGGHGSDAVAGGTAGEGDLATDLSGGADVGAPNLSDSDFAGLTDADIGFARGGLIRKRRGHFASGGADDSGDDSLTQNPNDPDLPLSSMKNYPEVGGVIPPPMDTPMPARVATKTPETAAPADQPPPPRAVDDAKAASIVGSEAPASQFDRMSALGQPAVPGAPNSSSVPGAPSEMSNRQSADFAMGRGIQMPVGSPAPAVPPPRPQITPPTGQPPTAPPPNTVPSAALARARQGQPGQPGAAAPAYAPGQAVPQAPAVGALGAVKPGGNLNQNPSPPTGGFMESMVQIESNNRNIPSGVDKDYPGQPGSKSQGYLQIDTPTWRQFAATVPGASQYPNAMSAPRDIQLQVGATIPLARFGPRTQRMIEAQYGPMDKTQTLGALAAAHGDATAYSGGQGGQGGVQVAQAGASDYDPNAVLAHLNNGQPYFTAKDYADANSSKRPLFNAMMMAGFAMMGGESRNPMINIGRGGMAGMEFYQKQQNLEREWMGTQAQIDHLSHEDRRLDVQTGLEAQKMAIEMMMLRSSMDAAKETANVEKQFGDRPPAGGAQPTAQPAATTAGAPPPAATSGIGPPGAPVPGGAPTAPGTPPPLALADSASAPGGAGAPAGGNIRSPAIAPTAAQGQPAGGPAMAAAQGTAPAAANAKFSLDDVAKEDDPRYWSALAAVQDRRAAFDPQAANRAAHYRDEEARAQNARQVTLRNGQIVNRPGAAEAEAEVERQKEAAGESGRSSATPIEPYVTQPDGTIIKQRVNDPAHIKEVSEKGTFNGLPATMAEPPEYREQIEQAGATGKVLGETGQAALAGQANLEQAKVGAEARAKQIGEEDESASTNALALNTQNQRLEALKTIIQHWKPGGIQENLAEIANVARTFGVPVADPSSAYEFIKNSTGEVFDQMKEEKGQVRNMVLTGLSKANPSANIPSEANAAMIAQLQGVIHMRQDYTQAYLDWRNSPAGKAPDANAALFAAKWKKDHDIGDYVTKAKHEISYLGQVLPPKAKDREVGQVYMAQDGSGQRFRWVGGDQPWQPVK